MEFQIEHEGKRRGVKGGLKLYGTQADFKALRDSINEALGAGLIQGWIGVGDIDDKNTVFPSNGRDMPVKDWRSEV